MNSISRLLLLAAGLLAFHGVGAMAQQNNPAGAGGATLKSTTPGDPNDARSTAAASSPSGGTALKAETKGDTGKKVIPPENQASSAKSGTSTGPTGKQPQ